MQIDRHLADRRRKQQKRRYYLWGILVLFVAYFIAFGIFVLIIRSPAFRAGSITIEGVSAVPSSTVMSLLEASIIRDGNVLSGRNNSTKALYGFRNMLIWPSALPSSTVATVPQLAGVTIAKNYFFHTITVTVTERKPFAVWCDMPAGATASVAAVSGDEQCFWFDNNGIAFQRTSDTEGGAILVIHNATSHAAAINHPVLPQPLMANLISVLNVMKGSGLDIPVVSLDDLSLQQVSAVVLNGPTLHFSLRFSSDQDLLVLESLMEKQDFYKLQYIDFTVQNRAYYK